MLKNRPLRRNLKSLVVHPVASWQYFRIAVIYFRFETRTIGNFNWTLSRHAKSPLIYGRSAAAIFPKSPNITRNHTSAPINKTSITREINDIVRVSSFRGELCESFAKIELVGLKEACVLCRSLALSFRLFIFSIITRREARNGAR